jgi:hypothetical protein
LKGISSVTARQPKRWAICAVLPRAGMAEPGAGTDGAASPGANSYP